MFWRFLDLKTCLICRPLMELEFPSRYFSVIFLISVFYALSPASTTSSGDGEALLALKSAIDPSSSLQWRGGNFCKWRGVKECINGRVTKLVLERLNLTGVLEATSLNQLDQLRVLSFKENSISGEIPNLPGLVNLKSLYLNNNRFSGEFPASLSLLHRLKIIVLAGNSIAGVIPASLINLRRLYILYLQDNLFTGEIPPLNQTSLRYFNVSNNQLSGEVPATTSLGIFNASSFSGNVKLCGLQIQMPCKEFPPSISPAYLPAPEKTHRKKWKLIAIIAGSAGGFILLSILIGLLIFLRKKQSKTIPPSSSSAAGGDARREKRDENQEPVGPEESRSKDGGGGFSWEGDRLGRLVFLGAEDQTQMIMGYSLEDLLKASAETLGRGTMGSTYKAVMESGFIVTVKRLRDARFPAVEEFRRQMEVIGRLRHPNLVPLRAYFQAKEERLIVYDYFPNGSLFSLIHGTRGSGGGKPLHWTSCLKIAEDLASGILYIHQSPPGQAQGLAHGNLKSSNVLLGPDFESCLTDYGLSSFRNPDSLEESSASSLFYKAPESRDIRKAPTQQADVYSFGVLVLELLTGKTPFQDLVQEHGSDIPRWVRSVREEETESGDDHGSSNEASEEKLTSLLNIAMACVSVAPESRPGMREVLRMIRETRAEAQVSSNSSDHSPGRWSDTVQSLPREEHLSI